MNEMEMIGVVGMYSTEPGIYLASGINVVLMQLLVWSIARHSADIEIWRTVAFCLVVGTMAIFGLAIGGVEGLASGAVLGFVCGWVVLGYVFELETWQRGVMAAVGPLAAYVSFSLGYWLKEAVFGRIWS